MAGAATAYFAKARLLAEVAEVTEAVVTPLLIETVGNTADRWPAWAMVDRLGLADPDRLSVVGIVWGKP